MLETLWIFAVALIPPFFSWWMIRRSKAQTQANFRRAMAVTPIRRTQRLYNTPSVSDRYYLEGVGYLIGDISCRFNARSGYIRCAVNPQGPCQGCNYYEGSET